MNNNKTAKNIIGIEDVKSNALALNIMKSHFFQFLVVIEVHINLFSLNFGLFKDISINFKVISSTL